MINKNAICLPPKTCNEKRVSLFKTQLLEDAVSTINETEVSALFFGPTKASITSFDVTVYSQYWHVALPTVIIVLSEAIIVSDSIVCSSKMILKFYYEIKTSIAISKF